MCQKILESVLSSFGQKFIHLGPVTPRFFLILTESESGLKNILGNYLGLKQTRENTNFKILHKTDYQMKILLSGWGNLKPCRVLGKEEWSPN
ncbi:MAG: hypothetical protein CM15mP40_09300 [Alphaproteobacteria bacterium]|nr:MAG: hypothetical protein CM15mP40_09300 [Alphaproteobacteria bacterium]